MAVCVSLGAATAGCGSLLPSACCCWALVDAICLAPSLVWTLLLLAGAGCGAVLASALCTAGTLQNAASC